MRCAMSWSIDVLPEQMLLPVVRVMVVPVSQPPVFT